MKVIVSGLTAAGKTTLCGELARALDLPYFSASRILLDLLDNPDDEWSPDVDRRRRSLDLERSVDARMVDLLRTSDSGVFDSWGLPWYSGDEALRIWIDSTRASRVRKCRVSYLQRGASKGLEECADIVLSKDDLSRRVFRANWGFDIFTDRSVFDMVVDVSALIPQATVEDARTGALRTSVGVMGALADRGFVDRERVPSSDPTNPSASPVISWAR